eukprot:2419529-Amphidinium_carterae.1
MTRAPKGGDFCLRCSAQQSKDWAAYSDAKLQNSLGNPLWVRERKTKVFIIPTPRSAVPLA